MANGEADIETAKATGDPVKVAAAYAGYAKSMTDAGVTPKSLDYFVD